MLVFFITAIPDDPFNNKVGIRAGRTVGSFCELSKFWAKSTYENQVRTKNYEDLSTK